jgi:hypothetical protein
MADFFGGDNAIMILIHGFHIIADRRGTGLNGGRCRGGIIGVRTESEHQ